MQNVNYLKFFYLRLCGKILFIFHFSLIPTSISIHVPFPARNPALQLLRAYRAAFYLLPAQVPLLPDRSLYTPAAVQVLRLFR